MKLLLSLILSLLIANPCWAYLTATKIAVTSTSSSAGVSSTSEDSDCTDILGVSLTCPVQANFPQICLNGVCETSWPAGGSQTSGSSILAGNGSGAFTNVTLSGLSYSAGTLKSNVAIQKGTPSAATSFTISGLTSGVAYRLVLNLTQNTSNGTMDITFNGDTGSDYMYNFSGGTPTNTLFSAGSSSATSITTDTIKAGSFTQWDLLFQVASGSANTVLLTGNGVYTDNGGSFKGVTIEGLWADAALSSITITPSAGTVSGTWAIYQMN